MIQTNNGEPLTIDNLDAIINSYKDEFTKINNAKSRFHQTKFIIKDIVNLNNDTAKYFVNGNNKDELVISTINDDFKRGFTINNTKTTMYNSNKAYIIIDYRFVIELLNLLKPICNYLKININEILQKININEILQTIPIIKTITLEAGSILKTITELYENLPPKIVYPRTKDTIKPDYEKNTSLIKEILTYTPEENANVEDIKKRFFDTATFKGKEKTPEEAAKAKSDREQLNTDITQLVQTTPEFDSIDTAKSKINTFIK